MSASLLAGSLAASSGDHPISAEQLFYPASFLIDELPMDVEPPSEASIPAEQLPARAQVFQPVEPLLLGGVCEPVFEDINPLNSDLDASNPNGAAGGRINGLAGVAGDNDTFYAASEWGGLFKSTDGGVTWNRLDGHLPVAAWDIEVNPTNTSIVYATSFYDGRVNPISGIQVSYDAGATWIHPATAHPDPLLEGTPDDNTPDANFLCADPGGAPNDATLRTEPSAFGIGIRSDASKIVVIGTNCGVARSTDSGATWEFRDPSPNNGTGAMGVWDVVVQPSSPGFPQGIIDICGDEGHFRSTDGGVTYNASAGALPTGRCSIAVSPDEPYVLFVAAADNNLYESDDAGATWTNLGNPQPQGRIPFVATNQRSDSGGNDRFDVWFGDVQLFRADCTTPNPPNQGGSPRCLASGSWTNTQSGAHWDSGDLIFDTEEDDDACPMIYSNDGGVYYRNSGCADPTWEQPDVVPHAEWLFSMDGADQAGDESEDLYFGTQDIGSFASTDAGAADPSWSNKDCCDVFDMVADSNRILYTVCCSSSGRANRLFMRDPGMTGGGEINTYPSAATLPGFRPIDIVDTFGDKQYVIVDRTPGVYFTNDITASPIQWTQLGANLANACGVQAAVNGGGTPTFYVQAGVCNERTMGNSGDQLWRYTGTGPGTWTRVDTNLPASSLGIGIFAVDPNDPNRLYASNIRSLQNGGPQMAFSNDGGQTWQNDADLDNMMTGGGVFKYRTERGPSNFTQFRGYPQPTLVAFDPEDPDIIVAGGRDSGVFLSRNGGNRWDLLSDPFDSANSGIPHLPRPWFAYFDHEPADSGEVTIYIGTQGRGVWRVTVPIDVPVITIPSGVTMEDTCLDDTSSGTLYVCNTGGGCDNLEVDNITSSDSQFSVTEPSSGYPVVISSDFCFPFQVIFTPTSAGPQSTTLTISSNDPAEPVVEVQATGTGTVPDIAAFLADNGYFGDVCLGDFADLELTIVNNGGCDLIVSDIASDSVEFVVPSKPPPDLVIGPGNSLAVPIRYQPNNLGASNATISITSNDPDTPLKTVDVSGDTPPGDITVTGSTDFGDVCAEELAEKVLDVCNVGACNLYVDSASIDCPDFTIINNPFPATVSPDFCMGLTIRFTPTSAGSKVCNLTLTSDDPDTPVVVVVLTGNTPIPSIDVPPNVAFAPTVVQEVDACETFEPFPVSNTGTCNLEITELEIAENSDEYSLAGLPSFPIILQPGHIAGAGDLDVVFAPLALDRDIEGDVSVTYVSDPITGATTTVTRDLCGEGVRTGARVLVTIGGVPVAEVKMIKLRRVVGNNNQSRIKTVETAKNVPLSAVVPAAPCEPFQYHREYGTVSNGNMLLPGNYLITVKVRVPGLPGFQSTTVGFNVRSCDFNPNITVDF